MWPDRVSNPGPPTYESGALPIALRGPATLNYAGIFDFFCMLSNYISLVSRNSDTDPQNISLISSSVSVGQKTCSSKGVIIDRYRISSVISQRHFPFKTIPKI